MAMQEVEVRDYWAKVFSRRKTEIQEICPIEFKDSTFEEVQTATQNLIKKHENKRFSRALKAISPTLEKVNSFTRALTTLSTLSMGATITWGTLQILIEYVCRFSAAIETSLDIIAKVNNALPMYDRASALYPGATSLRWPLQRIFDNCIDCYILIIKEFDQSGLKSFFKALTPSNLTKSVAKKIQNIDDGEKEFFQLVEQIEREATTSRGIQQARTIGAISTQLGLTPEQALVRGSHEARYPVRTIEVRPNPLFVGREAVLEKIHEYLFKAPCDGRHDITCCVIHGLGGQGKTQTALAYYWKYRDHYDAGFWLKSSTAGEIKKSYVKIAKRLRQANILGSTQAHSTDTELSAEVGLAREWLEGTDRKWLLIFDNLEDANLIDAYLPQEFSRGSIIITTQKAHMSPITNDFNKIELQPLASEDCSALLFKIWGREPSNCEKDVSHEISEWVGGLPLAIVTIAGYLKRSESSVKEIFDSLKLSSRIWASTGKGIVGSYEKTLSTVFGLALGEISHNSRHLLQILAFLDPLGIPEEMLRRGYPEMPSLGFLNCAEEYLTVREDLGERQLIKRVQSEEGMILEIHRSLQLNLLLGMTKELNSAKRLAVFHEVTGMLQSVLPAASRLQQNEKETWPFFEKYGSQILSLRRNSQWPDPPISLEFSFAKMLSNIGTFLWHTGQIRECDSTMKTAVAIIEAQPADFKASPECEVLLSDIYLVTGIIADCVGVSRRQESLDHREELLRMREKELKTIEAHKVTVEDEIRWGNAKGDLACAYMQRSRYSEAKEIMTELLKYYQKWGREDDYPYEYSKYYLYLGYILMAEGKPEEALDHARKGLELETAHADGVDSTVLLTQYSVASLLFNAGEVQDSLRLHQETLDRRLEICGKNSQYTLESYEAIGILHHLVGENKKAAECFKICIISQYRANWTREGVARARYWYSKVLASLGEKHEADKELETALLEKSWFLKNYPQFLFDDEQNEGAIFDQMLPMWVLQLSGPLQTGGRTLASTTLLEGKIECYHL